MHSAAAVGWSDRPNSRASWMRRSRSRVLAARRATSRRLGAWPGNRRPIFNKTARGSARRATRSAPRNTSVALPRAPTHHRAKPSAVVGSATKCSATSTKPIEQATGTRKMINPTTAARTRRSRQRSRRSSRGLMGSSRRSGPGGPRQLAVTCPLRAGQHSLEAGNLGPTACSVVYPRGGPGNVNREARCDLRWLYPTPWSDGGLRRTDRMSSFRRARWPRSSPGPRRARGTARGSRPAAGCPPRLARPRAGHYRPRCAGWPRRTGRMRRPRSPR